MGRNRSVRHTPHLSPLPQGEREPTAHPGPPPQGERGSTAHPGPLPPGERVLCEGQKRLLDAARELSAELAQLTFPAPVAHVYDPHRYAWAPYQQYVMRFGKPPKQVVLLGMNPGPFGMMQTGVPFGEVAAVRDWMGIRAPVDRPSDEHAKRTIQGFDCPRSEVSGRRLWGWAAERFGTAQRFFDNWFVLNYCPLALLEESGRNFTPDRLPAALLGRIYSACDRHLAVALSVLTPEWAIGIGGFAEKRIRAVLESNLVDSALARRMRVGCVLHPSPASPVANRGWAQAAEKQLIELGVPIPLPLTPALSRRGRGRVC